MFGAYRENRSRNGLDGILPIRRFIPLDPGVDLGNDGKSFVLHHYRVDACREKLTLRSATEW
jgi:hypothetical protein